MMRAAILVLIFLAAGGAPTPAEALSITNDTDGGILVIIERWQRRINAGDTATFNSSENPTRVMFETHNFNVACEAGPDDEIRFSEDTCYVNGVASGESLFHM
jgi:hypothetical protein